LLIIVFFIIIVDVDVIVTLFSPPGDQLHLASFLIPFACHHPETTAVINNYNN